LLADTNVSVCRLRRRRGRQQKEPGGRGIRIQESGFRSQENEKSLKGELKMGRLFLFEIRIAARISWLLTPFILTPFILTPIALLRLVSFPADLLLLFDL
jgi:hypothetical protein